MDEFGSRQRTGRFAMRLIDLAEVFRDSTSRCFAAHWMPAARLKAINAKAFRIRDDRPD